jgi:hypothetical protein
MDMFITSSRWWRRKSVVLAAIILLAAATGGIFALFSKEGGPVALYRRGFALTSSEVVSQMAKVGSTAPVAEWCLPTA